MRSCDDEATGKSLTCLGVNLIVNGRGHVQVHVSGRYPSAEQRGNVVQQFRGRAGRSGAVDPGHDGSWEVFCCVAGLAIVDDGDTEYALHAGDALVIRPSLPHGIHNRGTEAVVVAWAGGPGALAL